MGVDQLAEDRPSAAPGQIVGEQAAEGMIAHDRPGAEDGVSETEGFGLMDVGERGQPFGRPHRLELGVLAPLQQGSLQLGGAVEVGGDQLLAAAQHHHHDAQARGRRLLDTPLQDRPVENGEQLLGQRLGRGEEACPQAGCGNHAVAQVHRAGIVADGTRSAAVPLQRDIRVRPWRPGGSERPCRSGCSTCASRPGERIRTRHFRAATCPRPSAPSARPHLGPARLVSLTSPLGPLADVSWCSAPARSPEPTHVRSPCSACCWFHWRWTRTGMA